MSNLWSTYNLQSTIKSFTNCLNSSFCTWLKPNTFPLSSPLDRSRDAAHPGFCADRPCYPMAITVSLHKGESQKQGWLPSCSHRRSKWQKGASRDNPLYCLSNRALSWVRDSQNHLPCWELMRSHKQQSTWSDNAGKAQLKISHVFRSSLLEAYEKQKTDKQTHRQK